MIAKQKLDHPFAGLADFIGVGGNDHALADGGCTGRLKLGHFFDFYNAHPASALHRQIGVITKGGNLDARTFAGVNEERSRRSGELFAVYDQIYVSHDFVAPALREHRKWRQIPSLLKRTGLPVQMIFKLLPEFFNERHRRHRGRVSEGAKRFAQHVLGEVVHIINVFFYTAAGVKTVESFF
jgi:hypothetical protein